MFSFVWIKIYFVLFAGFSRKKTAYAIIRQIQQVNYHLAAYEVNLEEKTTYITIHFSCSGDHVYTFNLHRHVYIHKGDLHSMLVLLVLSFEYGPAGK